MPLHEIDHINRNKTDNRIKNLRDVSKSVNQHNSGNYQNNKSGRRGVFQRPNGQYFVYININKVRKNLGTFKTLPEAIAAREAAEQQLL